MATFSFDSMTDTNWRELRDDVNIHTGEVGASWKRHPSTPSSRMYIFDNKVHCGVWGLHMASGLPVDADYDIECDYTIKTNIGSLGLAGRIHPTQATFYHAFYQMSEGIGNQLLLWRLVNGVPTTLDWWDGTLAASGTTHTLRLSMHGDEIKVFANGIERISYTDPAPITAAGQAGVRAFSANDAHTGKHIDNFRAYDTAPDRVARSQFIGQIGL